MKHSALTDKRAFSPIGGILILHERAVAGLLTEPLGRPKVSGIAGDLRTAVSAGSETRAERGRRAALVALSVVALSVVAILSMPLLVQAWAQTPDGDSNHPNETIGPDNQQQTLTNQEEKASTADIPPASWGEPVDGLRATIMLDGAPAGNYTTAELTGRVVVSRPPIGDPILGPLSWGDEFVNGLFAVTHMSEPHVTFMGLPSGQEIHASLLNYDNNPGFGGGSYRVGEARRVPLRILAGWSNGHCDPPARLLTLVEHLEERRLDLSQLLGLPDTDVHNARELNRLATEIPNREIEVKGLGKLRLIDLLAASRYNYLRSHHKARSNKNSAAGTN